MLKKIEKLVMFRRIFVNSDLNKNISVFFLVFANFTLTSELT